VRNLRAVQPIVNSASLRGLKTTLSGVFLGADYPEIT